MQRFGGVRPKELRVVKPKRKLIMGYRLENRSFKINPKKIPNFLQSLDDILNEEAEKVENLGGIRPHVAIFWMENGEREYIKDFIRQPTLPLDKFYGRMIGIETAKVYHNHSKSYNMYKKLDLAAALLISENGESATFYTFSAKNVLPPFTRVNELARGYKR